ncbi:helix-turn-helix transcriptional regulator [Paraburkholderia gardini]|uniref:helix-turn-helix transcriptional regulator n=1 Tax=Paraburkholderia gardini TaxID=2823469 RepID=UPI001E3AD52E|nr:helix-turn-helix domain-containing protein [Paraburkholderia gardini]
MEPAQDSGNLPFEIAGTTVTSRLIARIVLDARIMPVTIITSTAAAAAAVTPSPAAPAKPKRIRHGSGHAKPRVPVIDITEDYGLLTVSNLMAILSIGSPTTITAWISAGKLPPPDMKIGRRSKWRTSTIRAYIDGTWVPEIVAPATTCANHPDTSNNG